MFHGIVMGSSSPASTQIVIGKHAIVTLKHAVVIGKHAAAARLEAEVPDWKALRMENDALRHAYRTKAQRRLRP